MPTSNELKMTISGKHIDIGDALQGYMESAVKNLVEKHTSHAVESHITLWKEGHLFKSDVSLHVGRGVVVRGHGESDGAHACFDQALERIAGRMKRHRSKIRDNHKRGAIETQMAQQLIFSNDFDDLKPHENGRDVAHPPVIAEMDTEIATLTVGEAVARLDLADLPVLVFRNSGSGSINVVYRRDDKNIGWIDPKNS